MVYEDATNVTGKVVLVNYPQDRYDLLDYQNRGAIGIVEFTGDPPLDVELGRVMYFKFSYSHREFKLPIVALNKREVVDALLNATDQSLQLLDFSPGVNEWYDMFQSIPWHFYQGSAILFTLIALIFGTHRLVVFIVIDKGVKFSLPQVAIFFEVLHTVLRLVGMWDILGSRRIYPVWLVEIFYTIQLPLVMAGQLLIALYWHDILIQTSLDVSAFLTKLKWLFFTALVLLNVTEVVTAGIRASIFYTTGYPPYYLYAITTVTWIIMALGLLIYFCIVSYKIFTRVKSMVGSRNSKAIRRLGYRIIIIATLLVFSITILIIRATWEAIPPVIEAIYWWLALNLLANLFVIVTVYGFEPSKYAKSVSSKKSGRSKDKSVEGSVEVPIDTDDDASGSGDSPNKSDDPLTPSHSINLDTIG